METIGSRSPVSDESLRTHEAVQLLHALIARVAEDAGIRALFVKGPILTLQGLRRERVSADVDVLVDPARFAKMQERLRGYGWRVDEPYPSAHVLPLRSRAYRHDRWPCEVAVHDHFPGFFADPQEVFEVLWARHATVPVAGCEVPCPDVLGHAAINALHALSDPAHERSRRDLAYMSGALQETLDEAGREDLAALSAATGAADTLRPLLDELGAPRIGVGSTAPRDLQAWHLRTHASGVKAVPYLYRLQHAPKRRWLPILWHALVLTEPEIRGAQPDAKPGAWGLLRARLRRLRWGVRDLPRAVRIIRQSRRRPAHKHRRGVRRERVGA